MLEDIRLQFDYTHENIFEALQALDEKISEYENSDIIAIKDINNFIFKLKQENLYDDKLDKFIDEYLKYHNN